MAQENRTTLKTYFETGDTPTQAEFASSIDSDVNINEDIVNGTSKATPIDADKLTLWDSVAGVLKTLSWANLKATLKTYFDTLYAAVLGADDNYVTDAEKVVIGNTSGANSGDAAPIQVTSITLTSGSWSLVSGLYEYDYANVDITVNSIVEVIPANADIAIVQAAEVLPQTDSSAGSVKLYATNAPTGDIGVTINITEKA